MTAQDAAVGALYEREKRIAKAVNTLKARTPCADCKNHFPSEAMDFDHVRGEKLFNISQPTSSHKYHAPYVDVEDIIREIAKCELVCANCHRVRTRLRRRRAKWAGVSDDDAAAHILKVTDRKLRKRRRAAAQNQAPERPVDELLDKPLENVV